MKEEGKCEDCGTPTKLRSDGQPWRKCFDCGTKAKEAKAARQDTLPHQTAQEEITNIVSTFKMAFEQVNELAPTMPPELKVSVAIDINNQYWKNQRTPR
jgi:hypothetical protein